MSKPRPSSEAFSLLAGCWIAACAAVGATHRLFAPLRKNKQRWRAMTARYQVSRPRRPEMLAFSLKKRLARADGAGSILVMLLVIESATAACSTALLGEDGTLLAERHEVVG